MGKTYHERRNYLDEDYPGQNITGPWDMPPTVEEIREAVEFATSLDEAALLELHIKLGGDMLLEIE